MLISSLVLPRKINTLIAFTMRPTNESLNPFEKDVSYHSKKEEAVEKCRENFHPIKPICPMVTGVFAGYN